MGRDKFEDYEGFVEKFRPKKTTDDCYTPPVVYDAVADMVAAEYGIERKHFVRPFYPGGDYQCFEYGPEDVVVDNPPFSIFSQIVSWYVERGVRFFLFAPMLTLLSGYRAGRTCIIPMEANVTYENGAVVSTSFCTNLERNAVRCWPELYYAVEEANRANIEREKPRMPKYEYPPNILTTAGVARLSNKGAALRVKHEDCVKIRALDAQRETGKEIFGGALLLSEKAAAEKAAAEKAVKREVIVWELSEREKEIVKELGRGGGNDIDGSG